MAITLLLRPIAPVLDLVAGELAAVTGEGAPIGAQLVPLATDGRTITRRTGEFEVARVLADLAMVALQLACIAPELMPLGDAGSRVLMKLTPVAPELAMMCGIGNALCAE